MKATIDALARQHPIIIQCPTCGYDAVVYHMEWAALVCIDCEAMNEKENWTVKNDMRPKRGEGPGPLVWMLGCGCVFWAAVAAFLWWVA